ncbi:MAG: hypothetical protein JWM93_1319 [Frankiales bacterium]|nr:hypothetical protein [Frankiales bacterium]
MTEQLRKVFEASGPFVSLYLDATASIDNAAQLHEVRWRDAARALTEEGVDAKTTRAAMSSRGELGDGDGRVVVAARGEVLLATNVPGAPAHDIVLVAALPHLVPVLADAAMQEPHVFALVDRTGADITSYVDSMTVGDTAVVDSLDLEFRRFNLGGWRQRRLQTRALDSWEENGKRIAAQITDLAAEVSARLVVLAGDVHEVVAVKGHLPAHLVGLVEVIDGGRSPDGSEQKVRRDRSDAVRRRRLTELGALVTRFDERAGEGRLTAAGVAAVAHALGNGQVETLLLPSTGGGGKRLAFGHDLTQLAETPDDLEAAGIPVAGEAAAVDVLVRAAVGTAAAVVVVPEEVPGAPTQVSAILRFDLPAA